MGVPRVNIASSCSKASGWSRRRSHLIRLSKGPGQVAVRQKTTGPLSRRWKTLDDFAIPTSLEIELMPMAVAEPYDWLGLYELQLKLAVAPSDTRSSTHTLIKAHLPISSKTSLHFGHNSPNLISTSNLKYAYAFLLTRTCGFQDSCHFFCE